MPLAATLRATASLLDLPRLVSELGHEPLWEELPPWDAMRRAAIVGRHGEFVWIGAESGRPVSECARSMARRVTANGCAAGVLVVYPPGREIGIAAGLDHAPVLRLSLDDPDPVSLAALARLRGLPSRSPAAFAARAADVLTGRNAGHEFFRQFRETVAAMSASLESPKLPDPAHRRALVLLQLTRVLFLYFVQSRGWLDGRQDFLRASVDACLARGRSVQRNLLQPLFFGTLNRPAAERGRAARELGAIPFLNGGLFEPHPLERRAAVTIPDVAWREAFDELFERYHFTVTEADPAASAIAPDMLGRVFEGVMEPSDRKASGTFYTPAALVRELTHAACTALVSSRLHCSDREAAERIGARDRAALVLLSSATVLDPACGSGAFLLGGLDALAMARVGLGEPPGQAWRAALRTQLFGVDLSPMAVRLAELRLWLAIVSHEPSDSPHEVAPLPNLDCLIRQGDALHAPFAPSGAHPAGASEHARLTREALVSAVGTGKRRLIRELERIQLRAAADASREREQRAAGRIADILERLRAPTLFGDRARPSPADRRLLRDARAELRAARSARRAAEQGEEIPWFEFRAHFPDVMSRGGFDIVVGNPPWVRAEALSRRERERLSARYGWWKAQPAARGYRHQPDLSVAFLERAHELAAPAGTVAMLVPAKLASAGYATVARGALAATTAIHVVADLTHDPRADFGATVYPMALVTTRRPAPPKHLVRERLDPDAPGTPQVRLGSAPWPTRSCRALDAVAKAASSLPPIGQFFRCRLGVKTGADPIFLDPPVTDTALVRPAIRGRDIAPFSAEPRCRILWTHAGDGDPLAALPPEAAQFLRRHEERLRSRADHRGGPFWQLFRTKDALAPHRVVWPDLARTLAAARPAADAVALNTCYVLSAREETEADRLVAWLNSTPVRALARLTAQPASGGYARYGSAVVSSLPTPPADAALAGITHRACSGETIQEELDDRVGRMLGLGPAERSALAALARGGADDRG
ncbi:MAG TPA: N-6 DNA methylase [Gemmatimonadales bacterium]